MRHRPADRPPALARLRQVVTEAGFLVQSEDVRWCAPVSPEAPPEVQLFLVACRTD